MTATYQMPRDIGWGYFEKLAKQKIMQVQSAADPPKKLALGERAMMADGIEYGHVPAQGERQAGRAIYPAEGTPLIVGPDGVFKAAPNPNAARLSAGYMFTAECQQLSIDHGGLRSVHALTKEKPGRKPMSQIKLMKDDAAAVEKMGTQIKARYSQISRSDTVSCFGGSRNQDAHIGAARCEFKSDRENRRCRRESLQGAKCSRVRPQQPNRLREPGTCRSAAGRGDHAGA